MVECQPIGVILAGGRGRRMGYIDKGELIVNGRRLVDWVAQGLCAQGCELLISGSHDYGLGVSFVADDPDGVKGPVAGLFSASAFIQKYCTGQQGFFTSAVDSPYFPDNLCQRLYSPTHSQIAMDGNGLHPTFAWWRLVDIQACRQMRVRATELSLKAVAQMVGARYCIWAGKELFFNINHANDVSKIALRT